MTCKHLRELYETCRLHNLKLSSSDLIRIVCTECGIEEVCPSVLCDEYETRHKETRNHESVEPEEGRNSPNRGVS